MSKLKIMEEKLKARSLEIFTQDLKALKVNREKFAVDLRKKNRTDYINEKRYRKTPKGLSDRSNGTLLPYVPVSPPANYIERFESLKAGFLAFPPPENVVSAFEEINNAILADPDKLELLHRIGITQIALDLTNCNSLDPVIQATTFYLANLTAGQADFTTYIVNNSGIDKLLSVISLKNLLTLENILWALANLVTNGPDYCTICINKDIIPRIQRIVLDLKDSMTQSLCETIGFLLRNISAYCDVVPPELVVEIVKIDCYVLDVYEKYQVEDCVISLYNLSKENRNIDVIIELKGIDCVIKHMFTHKTVLDSMKILGSVLSGTEEHTEYMLKKNVLDTFYIYIDDNSNCSLVSLIMRSLSNIAASSRKHITLLVNHKIFPIALSKLSHYNEDVRLEASFMIMNFYSAAKKKDKLTALKFGLFEVMAAALKYTEPQFLINSMCACFKILEIAKEGSEIREKFEQSGCLNSLNNILLHPQNEVSETAQHIYSYYYPGQYD
jgi:hypothetical protein